MARALAATLPDGYFVGGCVRDCLLDLPIKDVDLALPGSPWPALNVRGRVVKADLAPTEPPTEMVSAHGGMARKS